MSTRTSKGAKKPRRAHDAYYTPTAAVETLIAKRPLIAARGNVICEPCVGDGAISKPFADRGLIVVTNDIRPTVTALVTGDAAYNRTWDEIEERASRILKIPPGATVIDWVVTNPPFVKAMDILKLSYERARLGVAMFLRLSILEPTDDRGPWFSEHPPDNVIAVPRISFTGDGHTDSVICAWLIWYAPALKVSDDSWRDYPAIEVVAKPKIDNGMETLPL